MNRRIVRIKNWLNDFHLFSEPSSETNGQVPRWAASLWLLWCLFDFATFTLVAAIIGGDAINGHSFGDQYFVCMQAHCHEVTKAVFEYSRWHVISLFISLPIAFVLFWLSKQPKPGAPRK